MFEFTWGAAARARARVWVRSDQPANSGAMERSPEGRAPDLPTNRPDQLFQKSDFVSNRVNWSIWLLKSIKRDFFETEDAAVGKLSDDPRWQVAIHEKKFTKIFVTDKNPEILVTIRKPESG